ncbi:HflC [Buchnera aphidicola str. Bp (Baizongia pistaciae)]|uniref:Protein HflC n=1 Tax=Buchnera aphidicola subsp. Baizongia pistaciae (strain Bp) TaxID=224915 RepID=HFLC_BUCBP|nr:protease modulator HflC [Buchnera aphidicola]Q89A40.1 RecName: Full=Protein HflC [Buchnera aphidicola str. Bp (Baizongia pistaciae)]AAO27215.1 HflC [Buchnera aphidicola str. Bp (Baizongia pistaciae)]
MRKVILIILIVVVIYFFTCFFIIKEGQRGIILRFGKISYDDNHHVLVYKPGLHIKLPFIESVKIFNSKIQTIDNRLDSVLTKDNKNLVLNTYINWKINDFCRYYLSTGEDNIYYAETLIKQKFNNRLRAQISHLNIKEIIFNVKDQLTSNIKYSLNASSKINYKNVIFKKAINGTSNQNINQENNLLQSISDLSEIGVQILDVRIGKISVSEDFFSLICSRINSEYRAIAKHYRLMGDKQAEELKLRANYEVVKILSKAQRSALIIKSEGEALVAKLFSDAFSQEPEFFSFIRSLQAYENIFKKKNQNLIVVNENNSSFLRYMYIK